MPRPTGLVHERLAVAGTDAVAEVYTADLKHVRLVVVDARTEARSAATVEVLRREAGARVAVNGTFFDEKLRPLGLQISEGTMRAPLRAADWGVLFVDADGRAGLVHTRDFEASETIDFAVQCGPRVVIDGEPPGLVPQVARRTGACVLTPDSVALFVVDAPVSAPALADWLAASRDRGGLGCRDALLLDGGPSTQLDDAASASHPTVGGGWPVPNAVAIVDRR